MSTIVTRSGKGSPLTHNEVDTNFSNLNTDKIQSGNTVAALTITSATVTDLAVTGITSFDGAQGTAGQVLTSAGTGNTPTWTSISSGSGTVTSVAATVPTFLAVTGSPITTSGTLAIAYSGTALPVANGGTGLTTAGSAGQVLTTNGSTLSYGSSIVSGTAVASTSGTSIDFTSIPSWVKRITVSCQAVSTSGTSLTISRLMTTSGAETTNYVGYGIQQISNSSGLRSYTEGFSFGNGTSSTAASAKNGAFILSLLDSSTNTWSMQGQWADIPQGVIIQAAGTKSLASALTGIRLTTVNGTDTFDAGTINILYE